MERAAAFAWDLTMPRAVLLADIESMAGTPFADLVGRPEEGALRHRLAEAARASLGPGAIVWERSREIGALVSTAGRTRPTGRHAPSPHARATPTGRRGAPRPTLGGPGVGPAGLAPGDLRELGETLQAEVARRMPGVVVGVGIGGIGPIPSTCIGPSARRAGPSRSAAGGTGPAA